MSAADRFGKLLKEARKQAGLSQGDVAKKFGYGSAQFISNWERGISQPPYPNFKLLSKLYNLDIQTMRNLMLEVVAEREIEVQRIFFKDRRG